MRHGKKFNHLGRTASHRKAMLANMATSLIMHKRINTTVAKAKALRTYVEPLITKAKQDNMNSRRVVFGYLQNKYAVSELFRDVADKVGDRPGGYTRIIKTGSRLGDGAEMAMIELVDYNEVYSSDKPAKKSRRRRRGGKKAGQAEGINEEVQATEEVVENVETASEGATVETTVEETPAEPTSEVADETKAVAEEVKEVEETPQESSEEASEEEKKDE